MSAIAPTSTVSRPQFQPDGWTNPFAGRPGYVVNGERPPPEPDLPEPAPYNPTISHEVAKLRAIIAEKKAGLEATARKKAAIEQADALAFLNDEGRGAKTYAALASEELLLKRAMDAGEKRVAELCVIIGREAYRVEKVTRLLWISHAEEAKKKIRSAISQYFAPEQLEAAVSRAKAVLKASHAINTMPAATGGSPTMKELHPNCSVDDVLDAFDRVQAAHEEAKEFGRTLRDL